MRRLFLTTLVALSLSAVGQSSPSYLLLPHQRAGIVTRHSTEASLIAQLGRSQVVWEPEFGFADLPPVGATVLWPKDPSKTLRIVWKDPKKRNRPDSVVVYGTQSRWMLPNGIKIGTDLARLELLNGRPFTITGFDWDYGGVPDFGQGRLGGNHGVNLVMTHGDEGKMTEKEQESVTGERTMKTTQPSLRKSHPSVERIQVDL